MRRKPLRLKEFDYSTAGLYFITICAYDRQCLLGSILNDSVELSAVGEMVKKWWYKLPVKFAGIKIDESIIMPNHLHGIVNIIGGNPCLASKSPSNIVGGDPCVAPKSFPPGKDLNPSLPRLIQWFKTMSTNEYLRYIKTAKLPSAQSKLWQRNYYEHVIRNEQELYEIRKYIIENPLKWSLDPENPLIK
ncbi:MAG: transposase [bacterium]|jgi:REP element-mobilizing transposase RayT